MENHSFPGTVKNIDDDDICAVPQFENDVEVFGLPNEVWEYVCVDSLFENSGFV